MISFHETTREQLLSLLYIVDIIAPSYLDEWLLWVDVNGGCIASSHSSLEEWMEAVIKYPYIVLGWLIVAEQMGCRCNGCGASLAGFGPAGCKCDGYRRDMFHKEMRPRDNHVAVKPSIAKRRNKH